MYFHLLLVAILVAACSVTAQWPGGGGPGGGGDYGGQPGGGQQSIAECLGRRNVPVSFPNSAGYSGLSSSYNSRLTFKPACVVSAKTTQHVRDAVVCATAANVKVQAKSGGHSYASFSVGGKDGSMIIDLQAFQTVQLNSNTNAVTVGGGVRLGNLAQGIYDQGKRAVSHGLCPGVGIGGHFTHGGYGQSSRNWGLALDHVLSLEVVLADGSLTRASSTTNTDLFWALRGAAESIGIVTSFELRTNPAPTSVTAFRFAWFGTTGIFRDQSTFTNTFLHLQDVARNASVVDSRLSFAVNFDGSSYSVSGAFFGTVADFNAKIRPELLRGLPTPSQSTVQADGWLEHLALLGNVASVKQPLTGYSETDNFFAKSLTVPSSNGLSAAALNALYNALSGATVAYYVLIQLYGGPGSQINTKNSDFSAYVSRDSLWVMQFNGKTAASVNFVTGLSDAVTKAQSGTRFGAYLNYVDPTYDAPTAHRLYYGDAVYARLLSIKNRVDPKQTFWNPQSIGAV